MLAGEGDWMQGCAFFKLDFDQTRLFFLLDAIIVLVGGHTSQGILSHSFSLDAAPVNFNYEANFSDRSYYAFESGV